MKNSSSSIGMSAGSSMPVTYCGLYVQMCAAIATASHTTNTAATGSTAQRGAPRLPVDAVTEYLQRRGDEQAGAQHDQILPAVHHLVLTYRASTARARPATSPTPATCSRLPVPTVARWSKIAKSMFSMRSRISEYSV